MKDITLLLVDDDIEVIELNKRFFEKKSIKCLQLQMLWMLLI